MKTILIKNGILYDLKNNKYDKKDISMSDGKIIEISENLSSPYEDTEIIDLKEKFVFPGFIDCHTHLGIIVNASEILNCQDRIGKLEVGYDADIVVYDGNPLDINSKVEFTIIDGKIAYKRE